MSRTALSALLLSSLLACSEGSGLNGPQLAEPVPGEGVCFLVDLTDGLGDAEELTLAFDCFNQYGAFEPMAPLVHHLADSSAVDDALTAANGVMGEVDLGAGLETAANLLSSPDEPLTRLTQVYVEVYDRGVIAKGLYLARDAADAMTACEQGSHAVRCSLPRLARSVLNDQELMDAVDAVSGAVETADLPELTDEQVLAAAALASAHIDEMLDVGRFLFEPRGERAPIEDLLELGQAVLAQDALVDAVVTEVAQLHNRGHLEVLPGQLEYLLTHDSRGREVGFDGENVFDEMMAIVAALVPANGGNDTHPLFADYSLEVGGGSAASITPVEFMISTLTEMHEAGISDPRDMMDELDAAVSSLCSQLGQRHTMCEAARDLQRGGNVVIQSGVMDGMLPAVVGVFDTVPVMDVVEATFDGRPTNAQIEHLQELGTELTSRTRFLTRFSFEQGLLDQNLALVPAFVNTAQGRLNSDGRAALLLARYFINVQTIDDDRVVPALVPTELLLRITADSSTRATVSGLVIDVAGTLDDPDSQLSLSAIESLRTALEANVVVEEEPDVVASARELLDNEALWQAALRLGADDELIEHLTPAADRRGAPWYLYDLIQRGVLDRLLSFAAGVMDMLDGTT